MRHPLALVGLLAILATPCGAQSRPFGTVRQQAERQQAWLAERLDSVLPGLMRREGVDMWILPMREYNEDPAFTSLVSPTTFAARRRTIYVFHDRGPAGGGVERLALGGTSQGGVYEAVRSSRRADSRDGRQAELWGEEQWALLREVIEARNPRVIAINSSRTFAFADGLTAGEQEGMRDALGPGIVSRFRPAEALAVDFIAARLPDEARFYRELMLLVHQMIGEMFSERVIVPGVTRTSDLVWWWRQRTTDLGLDTWFQPSVSVQRQGVTGDLGEDPVIQRGDVLHCDVGLTALRLNTDTQHQAYVLLPGETDAPLGLRVALTRANRLQDLLLEEIRPGRTGNEVLAATRARMEGEGLDGTVYTHPIGMHGHGAGPLIGLWDRQDGVPGRGDHRVMASTWFSSELQVTSAVPEWKGQRVRMALEEDFLLDADGGRHWVLGRQDRLHLVR